MSLACDCASSVCIDTKGVSRHIVQTCLSWKKCLGKAHRMNSQPQQSHEVLSSANSMALTTVGPERPVQLPYPCCLQSMLSAQRCNCAAVRLITESISTQLAWRGVRAAEGGRSARYAGKKWRTVQVCFTDSTVVRRWLTCQLSRALKS